MIILYAMDESGLSLGQSDALFYYGTFTGLLYLSYGPLGLISDFLLKQKNATLIGLIAAVIGYVLLMVSNFYIVVFGLLMIVLGVGLTSPNMSVLLGQLFEKKDNKRDFAFVVYLIAINVGAFLAFIISGLIGERYGYEFGFGIAALCSLVATVIFALTMRNMNLVEVNDGFTPKVYTDDHPEILDAGQDASFIRSLPPPLPFQREGDASKFIKRHLLVFIIGGMATFFWQLFEISTMQSYADFDIVRSLTTLGISLDPSYGYGLQIIFFVPVALGFLALIYLRKRLSTIVFVSAGLLMIAAHMILIYFAKSINLPTFPVALLGFVLLTFGELCLSAIALSYVTRLANVKYASTIVGLFMMMTFLGMKVISLFNIDFENFNLLILSVVPIVFGLVLFFLRKVFLQLSGGLE